MKGYNSIKNLIQFFKLNRYKKFTINNLWNKMILKKVNYEQLSLIAGNLAEIYKDGISISNGLELVIDTTNNKIYKNSLYGVLENIKNGKSLSESFKENSNLYPAFFTGIISIGENSGQLYMVLKGVSSYYEKLLFVKGEIINALIYPFILITLLGVLFLILVNVIIPNFYEIYNSMNILPPKYFIFLHEFHLNMIDNPIIMTTSILSWGVIIPMIVLKYILNKVNLDKFIKLNVVKSFAEYIMVSFFSIIINSGINISKGLEYCECGVEYNYLRRKIRNINNDIGNGMTLYESLENTGLFSKYTLAIIKIREETGTVGEGFYKISNSLESKMQKRIKRNLTFIQPILVITMGALIGGFIGMFILPMFDTLNSGIK